MSTTQREARPVRGRLVAEVPRGVIAGLAGGVVFGVVMIVEGMLPMVAELVGSSDEVVGGVVHLVIAAGLGAAFALLVPWRRLLPLLGAGLVYGAVWWVLGALLIMPAWLGMDVFVVDDMAISSLVGHLLFGLTAGAVLALLRRAGRG